MNRNTAFLFIGNIEYEARIHKQIRTLKKKDINVLLIHGNINGSEKISDNYDFEIISRVIHYNISKLFSFLNQLYFCFFSYKEMTKRKDIKIVVSHGLTPLLGGVLIKLRNRNIKLIYDGTELAVEREKGIKKVIWKIIQKFSLPFCDYITQCGKARLNYFKDEYRVAENKMILLSNYPNYKKIINASSEVTDRKIKSIYFGILGKGRFLTELVKAFFDLPDYELILIGIDNGGFFKSLQDLSAGHSNIVVSAPKKRKEINELLLQCDVGLSFVENISLNYYYYTPNKIYDYLLYGIPVITMNYPELLEDVEKNRVGVCVSEITSQSISKAIDKIISENMKSNITDNIKRKFSWESQEDNFLKIF